MYAPRHMFRKKGEKLLVDLYFPHRNILIAESFTVTESLTPKKVMDSFVERQKKHIHLFQEQYWEYPYSVIRHLLSCLESSWKVMFSDSEYAEFTDNEFELRRMENIDKTLRLYQNRGLLPNKVSNILSVAACICVEGPPLQKIFSPKSVVGVEKIYSEWKRRATWYERVTDYVIEDLRNLSHRFPEERFELLAVFAPHLDAHYRMWKTAMKEMPKVVKKEGDFILAFDQVKKWESKFVPSTSLINETLKILENNGVERLALEENPYFVFEREKNRIDDSRMDVYYDKIIFIGKKS